MGILTPDVYLPMIARGGGAFTSVPALPSGVVLTGFSGVGAKANAAPVHYQNFATLAQNATPAAADYLQLTGQITAGTGPVFVDKSDGLSGGCLICRTGPGDAQNAPGENFWHITNLLPAGTTEVYRAFWVKAVPTSGSATSAMQIKSFRSGKMGAGGVQYYQSPIFKSSDYINGPNGSWNVLNRSYIRADGTTVQDGSMDAAPSPNWVTGGWNFVEIYCRLNNIGQSNGVYWYKINGVTIFNESGFSMRTSSADTLDYAYLVPGMDAAPGTNWDLKYCNDYLDNSVGRVILTDSPTFAANPKGQAQPWASWADGRIEIPNPVWAGIASGQPGYFHIFDNITGAYHSAHARTAP